MTVFRIYAYEVTPQRTSEAKTSPRGGSFPPNKEFRKSLDTLFGASKLATQAVVDFKTDPTEDSGRRDHRVRSLVMEFLFGSPASAKKAAHEMATLLSNSMDERSPPTLLMLTGSRSTQGHRIVMWAFPQEEAFQFRTSGETTKIRLLTDIFSRSSRLRKAAMFEGKDRATDFWTGRVLDLQTAGGLGKAADYWITKFLDCRFALEGNAGTRLLVKYLRSAYDLLEGHEDREQIYSAMIGVRTSPRPTWSMSSFANHFLKDEAKRVFLQSVPTEQRHLQFRFQRQEFEDKLNFRIFKLKDDVFVSAPFGTVGKSVVIHDDLDGGERRLSCEGVVVAEKVRARHA
jgi:hypothetical protein